MKKAIIPTIILSMTVILSSCTSNSPFDYVNSNKHQSAEDDVNTARQKSKFEPNSPEERTAALEQANEIANNYPVSENAVKKKLEFGRGFSEEAIEYATNNMNIDWKENALTRANSYKHHYDMNNEQLYDKLARVESFTPEEAQYAINSTEPR